MALATSQWIEIEGEKIEITNPEKILWQDIGLTKLSYLENLARLGPYLIRYCEGRYLTTIRYPHGPNGKSFYQKNCPPSPPPFVRTALHNDVNYVVLDRLATLMWLGNLACLEFHPSFHRIDSDLPEEWMIDLDPTVMDPPRMTEAANIVGETLQNLNIQSVPKTSGATGIQIVIPIQPQKYTFAQLRKAGKFIADYLTEKKPHLFTTARLKKDRGQKIYFDYLQHWHGKTLSAAYTPRARAYAPVSTPLRWEELLSTPVQPEAYHLLNIHDRLEREGDLLQQVPPQNLDTVLQFLK